MAFYFCTKENTELILVFLLTKNKLYCIGLSDDFTKKIFFFSFYKNNILLDEEKYKSSEFMRKKPAQINGYIKEKFFIMSIINNIGKFNDFIKKLEHIHIFLKKCNIHTKAVVIVVKIEMVK